VTPLQRAPAKHPHTSPKKRRARLLIKTFQSATMERASRVFPAHMKGLDSNRTHFSFHPQTREGGGQLSPAHPGQPYMIVRDPRIPPTDTHNAATIPKTCNPPDPSPVRWGARGNPPSSGCLRNTGRQKPEARGTNKPKPRRAGRTQPTAKKPGTPTTPSQKRGNIPDPTRTTPAPIRGDFISGRKLGHVPLRRPSSGLYRGKRLTPAPLGL